MADPTAPSVIKAPSTHDAVETVPRDRVEGFFEIKSKDGCRGSRGSTLIASAEEVCCIDKILCNVPTMNEAGLVGVD